MNEYLEKNQSDFTAAIDFFKKDIASLRTGQANPSILEDVQIEAYGVLNPVNAVGNITVNDNSSMIITPWDKTVIKAIEKGLIAADLGLGIVNEGDKIRLTVPALTQENRHDLVKKLNDKMEKARIVIRSARDGVKDLIETAFDEKEMSEDDKFRFMKELDEFTARKNEELKNLRDLKEEGIMKI